MANEEKIKATQNSGNIEDPKLAAIKEIIFGENIKEYDSEFKSIHKAIDDQNEALNNKLEALKADLNKVVTEMKESFSKQLDAFKEDTKENMSKMKLDKKESDKALGEMLIEVGKKLKSS